MCSVLITILLCNIYYDYNNYTLTCSFSNVATAIADLNSVINITDFTPESDARYHYQINTTEGMTIRLCHTSGQVVLYASFTIPNPNSALNNFIIFHNQNCSDLFIDPNKLPSVTSPTVG